MNYDFKRDKFQLDLNKMVPIILSPQGSVVYASPALGVTAAQDIAKLKGQGVEIDPSRLEVVAPAITADEPAFEPLGRRQVEHRAEEALARDPDQDRAAECGDLLETGEELEVVARGLAEPDAGIERDRLGGDAGAHRAVAPQPQPVADVARGVAVARLLLHGRRCSAHVHEHDARPVRAHRRRHVGVAQCGDVVHDLGAGGECGTRDLGARRIHRHARPGRSAA